MRLIDAELLMRKCEKWLKPKAPDEDEMVSLTNIAVSMLMEIEEQPTAFDVEKVVKQLEEESEQSYVDFESYAKEHNIGSGFNDWHYKGLNRAIEIVKQGGRDEE